jgi:hypothetical protein
VRSGIPRSGRRKTTQPLAPEEAMTFHRWRSHYTAGKERMERKHATPAAAILICINFVIKLTKNI